MTLDTYKPYNRLYGGDHMPKGQLSEKNTTMSFAIPKTLKEEIGIIAQKENRSMSNLIVSLLDNYAQMYKQKNRIAAYYKLITEMKNNESDTE